MNKHFKYDPEDIESLMLAKSFEDLLPEERTFVLKHISSEKEYESLRHLLLESMEVLQADQSEPPRELKEKVMTQYRAHHETGTFGKIWLNFFAPLWNGLSERPYLSLAMASVALFLGVFFWLETGDAPQVAVKNEPQSTEQTTRDQTHSMQEESNEVEQESPPESTSVEKEVDKDTNKSGAAPENRTADSDLSAKQQELNEPEPPATSEQLADEAFGADDGASSQADAETKGEADSAAEPLQPAAGNSSLADAYISENSTTPVAAEKSVVNDELIALLYTAR